jgi:hypothetical protein
MNDCFVACLAVNHADDALYSLAEKMVGDRVSHFTFAQLYYQTMWWDFSGTPNEN